MGTPNETDWPGCSELPVMKKFTFQPRPNRFHTVISTATITSNTFDLLSRYI